MIKVNKRQSRIGADIYYIGYVVNKLPYNINIVNPLCLILKDVTCTVEKIEGSSDRYLVIDLSNKDVLNVFDDMFLTLLVIKLIKLMVIIKKCMVTLD